MPRHCSRWRNTGGFRRDPNKACSNVLAGRSKGMAVDAFRQRWGKVSGQDMKHLADAMDVLAGAMDTGAGYVTTCKAAVIAGLGAAAAAVAGGLIGAVFWRHDRSRRRPLRAPPGSPRRPRPSPEPGPHPSGPPRRAAARASQRPTGPPSRAASPQVGAWDVPRSRHFSDDGGGPSSRPRSLAAEPAGTVGSTSEREAPCAP